MEPAPVSDCKPFLVVTLLISIFVPVSIARDTITPTQPLLHGDTLVSSGGSFALGFFSPPNSTNRYIGVWYNNVEVQTVVWVANRNKPITGSSTGTLSLSVNGTLTITDDRNSTSIIWSTALSTQLANPVAQLLDSGNFVVKEEESTGSLAWQGFDYPTDTQLPGLKVGLDRLTGLRRNLTSWKSDSDPSPGDYTLLIDPTGDPEMVIMKGSAKVWRSGPWDGIEFSGVPTANLHGINFIFVNDDRELSYSYRIRNQSLTSRRVMSQSGVLERVVWIEAAGQWEVVWYDPREQCDQINQCGPFSLCNSNDSPVCSCLHGFTPKNPRNWALRDGSDGCVRKTELDCRNETDGFARVSHVKLPDTTNSTVDRSLSVDQCGARCLRNCSCTAYAIADIRGSGSGCVFWVGELMDAEHADADGGQDLYVRLAAVDLGSSPSQLSRHARMAILLSLSSVILLLSISACCLWRRKRRAAAICFSNVHSTYDGALLDDELELPLFNLAAVTAATEDFSFANKLGEGGFGCVYKGKFGGEKDVAVKRLAKTSIQGIDEFKNEVILIAKLQHRNLVRLLGCCIQGEEMMLIYEYMPNKSLDAYLFDKEKAALLDWQTRYRIIEGIARGLLYLHQDSRFRIIHRDLKASNILLDKDLNPKISDFGLARIFGGDETEVNTGRVVGTYGYMSPEYAMDGIFSMKSDVFSFGVLVLEIISGQRNKAVYSSPEVNLLINTWHLWNDGNGLQIVDESMRNTVPLTEVLKCMKVGLLCVQERPEDRPLMSSIVLMLASDSASLPQPLEPGYLARRGHFEGHMSSCSKDSCNELSITVLRGR